MSLFERIKTINEKKYLPNTPNGKKNLGNNISDKIRRIGGYRNLDPERQFYGSKEQDYAKGDRGTSKGSKPQFRPNRTAQGVETTSNIKKGSIPDPKKIKYTRVLPPAGSDTEAVQKNLLTGEDDYSKIKSRRGRKTGSVNKPKVNKTPGQLDIFNQPKPKTKPTTKPTKGVNQAEISKKASEFTAKVNKRRIERVSKKAERIKGATGGKTTGSLAKGNLSFPGDRSGAYKATKLDLDTRKLLKKAGASGDVSPTAGSKIRKRVETIRKTRANKLGTPDPFDIDTSKVAKQTAKDFGTPTTSDIKKGKLPKGYTAPKGDFGSGLTKGQANTVKKSFKKFQQDSGSFNAKKQAISNLRAANRRLGKPLSQVQQRKFAKDAIRKAQAKQTAEFNKQLRLNRMYNPFDDGDLGNPDAGKSISTKKKVPKTFKVKKPEDYKKTKQYKQQTQFLNKKTGKVFDMADPGQKAEFLKQQGKYKFVDQVRNRLGKEPHYNQFKKDFTSKSKRTYSGYTPPSTGVPTTQPKVPSRLEKVFKGAKRILKKNKKTAAIVGGVLGTAAIINALRPKPPKPKFNKDTKIQFKRKDAGGGFDSKGRSVDPSGLKSISKGSINYRDLQNFGKGSDKAYTIGGDKTLQQRTYNKLELKNTQRRVKKFKNKVLTGNDGTKYFKGDPYRMLDVKTRKPTFKPKS